MDNREKVIKGHKIMLEESKYNDSVEYNPWADTETLEAALALLKRQEAVEPKKNYVELAGLRTWDWACPECNCILTYRANYCSCCGRAVKWE